MHTISMRHSLLVINRKLSIREYGVTTTAYGREGVGKWRTLQKSPSNESTTVALTMRSQRPDIVVADTSPRPVRFQSIEKQCCYCTRRLRGFCNEGRRAGVQHAHAFASACLVDALSFPCRGSYVQGACGVRNVEVPEGSRGALPKYGWLDVDWVLG